MPTFYLQKTLLKLVCNVLFIIRARSQTIYYLLDIRMDFTDRNECNSYYAWYDGSRGRVLFKHIR